VHLSEYDEHTTFRKALNDAIREGLAARQRRAQHGQAEVKTTRARSLGPRLASFDNTSELIALIEGDTYR
jgi:hypothetical protein